MALTLTLLVPGLYGPRVTPAGAGPGEALAVFRHGLDLAALERVLSGAAPRPDPSADATLEGMLCRCAGLARSGQADWPVAAITRRLDGGAADERWYLRADPVHVRPDLRKVTVFDSTHFRLSGTEASALADEINHHFAPEGWRLEALHPERWYIGCESDPAITTDGPGAAAGEVDNFLPRGPGAAYWRGILNEIQMLLHASPVNAAREASREVAINSVWLWGVGRAPAPPRPTWRKVWADHPLARALAKFSGIDWQALPDGLSGLLESDPGSGEHLVVLECLYAPSLRVEVERWRAAMTHLCEQWFEPMLGALGDRRLAAVVVCPGIGPRFRADRARLRRWWRRPRALERWARSYA